MRIGAVPVLATCAMLAVLGVSRPVRAQHMEEDSVYGTWRWARTFDPAHPSTPGSADTPAGCRCERVLVFRKDGSYEFTERDSAHERSKHGTYVIHRATGENPGPRSWLSLEYGLRAGANLERRTILLCGRDTLLLRDADSSGVVADGRAEMFIRDPPSRAPEADHARVERPVPINKVLPKYSEFAKEAGIQGTVVLHVLVGTSGRVELIKVAHGIRGLNEGACAAAKQWVFRPAFKDSTPVAAWIELPFIFELPYSVREP
jgi:TonB family protein